jgi:hypothetical protein
MEQAERQRPAPDKDDAGPPRSRQRDDASPRELLEFIGRPRRWLYGMRVHPAGRSRRSAIIGLKLRPWLITNMPAMLVDRHGVRVAIEIVHFRRIMEVWADRGDF